jgi:tetratricopeptide (TPR) repeat protein
VELNPYDDEVLNNRAKHIHNTGYNLTVMPTDETNSSDAADKEYLENKKMGFDYGQKGDFENALKCMKRAVELKPTSAEALVNLAICYGMMNDYKDNIETLTKMLSLYPNSIIGLQNMVITYQRLGDKGKVAEYQKKIDALNGGNAGVPAKN